MKILWSEKALKDLEEIFQFMLFSALMDVAQRTTTKLVSKVSILTSYPEMGSLEDWGINVHFKYRSLIEGNYKIIYRLIDHQLILISRVYDTRMDPNNIKI